MVGGGRSRATRRKTTKNDGVQPSFFDFLKFGCPATFSKGAGGVQPSFFTFAGDDPSILNPLFESFRGVGAFSKAPTLSPSQRIFSASDKIS